MADPEAGASCGVKDAAEKRRWTSWKRNGVSSIRWCSSRGDANGEFTRNFRYPANIRKVIYTTNAIEFAHRQFRKLTKLKAFPE